MRANRDTSLFAVITRPAMVLLLLATAAAGPAAGQETKPAAEAPAAEAQAYTPNTYAGVESCAVCHEDIVKAFGKLPHNKILNDARHTWDGRACEACHGPGGKHAESANAADIRNPWKSGNPVTGDPTCLNCHKSQQTHAGRIQGSHARNRVACSACHSVHGVNTPVVANALLPTPSKAPAPDSKAAFRAKANDCGSCHITTNLEFQRPHGHRLGDGKIKCTDCHNPHGSWLGRSLNTWSSNEPGCLKCHGDKRGPFTFEHAPLRQEGCIACHEPHGSANPRMLTRHEVRFLCLECHSNSGARGTASPSGAVGGIPTGAHDLRSPRYRNCTTCHMKIHGSHVNRALLR